MFTMLGQAPQSHAQYLGSRPNQGVLCARLLGKRHAHAVQSAHSSPNTNCNLQHHAQRRKLLSTGVALPLWLISIPQIAVALPLAPLGCGSDTIGGPKLQQPALKQVQASIHVLHFKLTFMSALPQLLAGRVLHLP